MRPLSARWPLLVLVGTPFLLAAQQPAQEGPTCEQVFKNIQAFKGVPAKELIPAMEFMAASLKYTCEGCHDGKNFSKETSGKATARRMIAMVRDINAKNFGGRTTVTCNSCHNGRERPASTPIPEGLSMRHARMENAPKPEDLFQKHLKAVGPEPETISFTGTQTAPLGEGGKPSSSPVEMIQASGGRFRVAYDKSKFGSDGKSVWRDGYPVTDETAAIFTRIGRSWRGEHAFDGLERLAVSGKETLGKTETTVVRGTRTATGSTEELYFDNKTGLLVRFTNMTRSVLGTVVTVYDYSNYKSVKGTKAPMAVAITFAGGEKWTMAFKSATAGVKVDEATFAVGEK